MQVGDYVAVKDRTGTWYGELMEMSGLTPHRNCWVRMGGTANREIQVDEGRLSLELHKSKPINSRLKEPVLVYPYTNNVMILDEEGVCAASALLFCKNVLLGNFNENEKATYPDKEQAIRIQTLGDKAYTQAQSEKNAAQDKAMMQDLGVKVGRNKELSSGAAMVSAYPPFLINAVSRQAVRAHYLRYATYVYGHGFAIATTWRYMYLFDAGHGLYRMTIDPKNILKEKLGNLLRKLYPDVHTRTWTLMEIQLA